MIKKFIMWICVIALLLTAGIWASARLFRSQTTHEETHTVARGSLVIWSQFEGTMQSVNTRTVSSSLGRQATITWLAPEGQRVAAGDLLASLDRTVIEESLPELRRDQVLADSELQSLELAELPMALEGMRSELRELELNYADEQQRYVNTKELQEEDLVTPHAVEQQKRIADNIQKNIARHKRRLTLTEEILNPARLARSRAKQQSAKRRLQLATEQLDQTDIHADMSGMVIHQPLHMDGEYRAVKEGDPVYRNQKFMIIADMSNLAVTCHIPEAQLSLVRKGCRASVSPVAFPELHLDGSVEHVGSMAHTISGRPAWQRYFTVTVQLDDTDDRLRSDMSVFVHILSYSRNDVVLLPRRFVAWNGVAPICRVEGDTAEAQRTLTLGPGNATDFEVREGLSEGMVVKAPH
jgi:multidrug efflux pump subunit AcrA (membrane-fusion protein)